MVLNECLFSYWALAHPIFKITFQANLFVRFLATVEGVLGRGFSVHFCSAFHDMVSFGLMQEVDSIQKIICLHFYWFINLDLRWQMMHVRQCTLFTFDTLFYEYSHILWVVFDYFLHVLNINFKILGWLANEKNDFTLILNVLKI